MTTPKRYEETATAIVLVCRCKDLSDAETARSVIDNTAEALRTVAREAQVRVLTAMAEAILTKPLCAQLGEALTLVDQLRNRIDSGEDL